MSEYGVSGRVNENVLPGFGDGLCPDGGSGAQSTGSWAQRMVYLYSNRSLREEIITHWNRVGKGLLTGTIWQVSDPEHRQLSTKDGALVKQNVLKRLINNALE